MSDPVATGTFRRFRISYAVIPIAVIVGLLALTWTAPAGLFLHWTCMKGSEVASQYMALPVVLINVPYGGIAWGNGTLPASFPGGPGYPDNAGGYGTGAPNGTAVGEFFPDNLTLLRQSSELVAGPGPDTKCHSPYAVRVSLGWYAAGGSSVMFMGPGNTSDANEPTTASFVHANYEPVAPIWNNSFSGANHGPINTCGGLATSLYTEAAGLPVSVTFSSAGTTLAVPFVIPALMTFHYSFPADFGTWQIDNLSAPAGPGGGWAFSYSPCP